jgi:hypothetical protein
MGVDGFRFDLAPVLGRTPNAFERDDWSKQRQFFASHPLLGAIRDFAVDRSIEVIAEAWDLWGYEVGNFPSGWGEWNGRYRDTMRSFCKGDANTQGFIDQFNGDYAHFTDQGGPQHSVDFVTAHDGFTMADLVSYNDEAQRPAVPVRPVGRRRGRQPELGLWRRPRVPSAADPQLHDAAVPVARRADVLSQATSTGVRRTATTTRGAWTRSGSGTTGRRSVRTRRSRCRSTPTTWRSRATTTSASARRRKGEPAAGVHRVRRGAASAAPRAAAGDVRRPEPGLGQRRHVPVLRHLVRQGAGLRGSQPERADRRQRRGRGRRPPGAGQHGRRRRDVRAAAVDAPIRGGSSSTPRPHTRSTSTTGRASRDHWSTGRTRCRRGRSPSWRTPSWSSRRAGLRPGRRPSG